ncbi:YybH family protein [Phenylobacterium sp.]|uniref:YybH family protein n=1 Tax=Phenylobacterium sp. TaxID=1871053 RepID=UPI002FC6F8C9
MSEFDEIEALARTYAEAVLAKDPVRLSALYEADIRVFDTWGRKPFDGLGAWRANLDNWLNSLRDDDSVQVSFNNVQISSREAMGCLHALVTYAALNRTGETVRSMQNRLSWVVARSASGWTIIHEHTSVPIGPDLKGMLQLES